MRLIWTRHLPTYLMLKARMTNICKFWIRIISNSHKMRLHCNSRSDDRRVSRNIFRRCVTLAEQLKIGPSETLLRNKVRLAPGKTQIKNS
jgi:hypothetical protein